MKEKKQTILVTNKDTILNTIYNFKKDLSKKTIKQYLKNNMIKLNNQLITIPNIIVSPNDIIEISYQKQPTTNYNLDIIYEDDYLIAINKPSGLLSISNDKEKHLTAYRLVSDYNKTTNKTNYIFVVHRLDQDTSGILLFAKDQKIRDKMQENWNTITKKRGYFALVEGSIKPSGTFHSFLIENKLGFIHSTKSPIGKEAITHYELITKNNTYSLAQVYLETGRRNQIRVHFSENNTPIVGDKKYRAKTNPIKRLCLHANILEFIHPVTKKLIHLETLLPDNIKKLI